MITQSKKYNEVHKILEDNGYDLEFSGSIISITHENEEDFLIEVDIHNIEVGESSYAQIAEEIIKTWNAAIDYQEQEKVWIRPYVFIPELFRKER